MAQLKGKNIIVTGGSRGIGAGICLHLSELGARVAFSYSKNETHAQKVLKELTGEGHFCFQMDISSEESVLKALGAAALQLGVVDGLVNNAGITKDQLLLRMKTEDFDEVIHTNLRGGFLCTKVLLKFMLKQRAGSIVNITSVIGQTGNPGQSNYAASKAGLEAFSKSIAREVGSRGIRVNCVAPGFIVTDMTEAMGETQKGAILASVPLERLGTVQDVACATAFLLSDESAYITGQTLSVNGGMFM